ncbi:MAG: 2-oxo acid dehydrogenase subunit E2 [Nitrospirae bacterium CG_4_10_14_3_um_filter_44_29]|nr:MAG: branched-chain alpha-keto acid dehydrogenase subunit E2 [Nitrospirae bacterium CG22_combo_CG10-13_8_21_14_all_44_11]PIX88887.1 MAG: 2-oxo acid dehydrogenase subunit E2 [Nitrospirae bacterium CG_4_10_14_3_um_filter_44_29]
MPYDFVLPDLGEGITEGEIRRWLVKEGDAVEEHQTVLEIETDKAVVEVPSPKKGRVTKIHKEIADIAKVGEVLMTIADVGEAVEEKPKEEERPKSVSVVGVLPEEEEEVLAAPAVRALAKELGVKLESIKGSGPGGSITKDDVTEASEKGKKTEDQYGAIERLAIKGLRRTIAKNLIMSQKTTAFVTGMDEADITELWSLKEREKKALIEKGVHLTFLPFFIKAVHHALTEHPLLNASVDEGREEIIIKKYYNIGVAVDTPDGLMVPVIKNAGKKTILELASEIQGLSVKARERKIRLEEIKGSTFTITNYGHFGGWFATPIINYPDVAILGTGKISDKPWVKDGKIVIRKILPLSLTFDHRVTDGVDSAKFLSKVIQYLEDPALLFIESA